MAKTSIEWTKNADGTQGESWNPIRARFKGDGKKGWYCQKISPGCAHCYAERRNRWIGNGANYNVSDLRTLDVYLDEKALLAPLSWKKPTTIFVCSMTDLFGDWVPDEWIEMVYAIEALCPQHTFIHVTKRPERRLQWYRGIDGVDGFRDAVVEGTAQSIYSKLHPEDKNVDEWLAVQLPLPNVIECVTICNQDEADRHVPVLLDTPAACRGLSLEPLLEAVNLHAAFCRYGDPSKPEQRWCEGICESRKGIGLVIVGGESGPGARVCFVEHIRSLVQQCAVAGVNCFVKQLGANSVYREDGLEMGPVYYDVSTPEGEERAAVALGKELDRCHRIKFSDRKGGIPEEWPVDLRVRQFPEVRR